MSGFRRLLIRVGVESVVVFGLLTLVVYLSNWDLGYFGTILLAPGIVLIWQVQRLLHEPDPGPRPVPRAVTASTAFRRFQVLRERVRWGLTSREYFDTAVRPVLGELVDDRLLRHHGIDRSRAPGLAEAELVRVLGELAETRDGEAPDVAALARSLTRLEEL
jgi:hypothetical protein